MPPHDWKPISETYEAAQCAVCGTIRITWRNEYLTEFTRYSRPGANVEHCNKWYSAALPCEEKALPIAVETEESQ